MTSSSDLCVNLTPFNIPGQKFTGNFGTERWLFVPNKQTRHPIEPIRNLEVRPFSPKVFVGPIIPGATVGAVDSNISAVNVGVNTNQCTASRLTLTHNLPISEFKQLQGILNSPPVTPVKVSQLNNLLFCYDIDLKKFLIDGFSFGFRIGFVGPHLSRKSSNLRSAEEQPEVLSTKLYKEWSAGRIVGPFSVPPFSTFISSPLGVVPKKQPGEYRIIHHLSYPHGLSVNDYIPSEQSSVHYASIACQSLTS